MIKGIQDYSRLVRSFFEKGLYGDLAYLEAYLTGPEITVTVMPPGMYIINHQNVEKTDYWCLPPVSRFNHINGIAPYNGVVAVVNNSQAMGNEAIKNDRIVTVLRYCSMAGAILKPKAPIRIDCRANEKGTYAIFDVNFKPNMTGASRPQRADQDSLTMIAAKKMGWKYIDLLTNMLHSAWSSDEQSV